MITPELNISLGVCGAVFTLVASAFGSALGMGVCAMAAIGAWKRNYVQGKTASFTLVAFVGMSFSQTIYGMILMFAMLNKAAAGAPWQVLCTIGVIAGIIIGLSAWLQGKASAAGADAVGETGKGFVNALVAIGVIETTAIFVMVLSIVALGYIPVPEVPLP